MLPRLYRLKRKSDFDRLLKKGKLQNGRFLAIRFITRSDIPAAIARSDMSNDQENSRFGFLVAKKNFKKAFLRNKIRRRLREMVRQKLSLVKPGYDIVLIARPGIEDKKPAEVKKPLEILLEQAGLFKTQIK